jgi:hypothetical protein
VVPPEEGIPFAFGRWPCWDCSEELTTKITSTAQYAGSRTAKGPSSPERENRASGGRKLFRNASRRRVRNAPRRVLDEAEAVWMAGGHYDGPKRRAMAMVDGGMEESRLDKPSVERCRSGGSVVQKVG